MDSTNESPDNKAFTDKDLDGIIAQLDTCEDKLPVDAILAARQHRDQVVPRLIAELEAATRRLRNGEEIQGDVQFFALFLLTEFKAKEALPAILEAVSLPGRLPEHLFGDAIYDEVPRALATLAGDQPDTIDALIGNQDLDETIRWAAATSLLHLVRDGKMTRDDAVQRLHRHLRRVLEDEDVKICLGLVMTLNSLAPKEAMDDIRAAFERGMVEEFMINLEEIEASAVEGEEQIRKGLDRLKPTGIEDTIAELQHWAAFQEKPKRPAERATPPKSFGPGSPIESRKDRIGRNEPCPCGSGKKFKKCCGGRRSDPLDL